MTLVDHNRDVRRRIRRDAPINPIGVTTTHVIVWRIGDGPVRETPIPAVRAAKRRAANTADGQTLLGGRGRDLGEVVNESDVDALLGELKQVSAGAKALLCPNDHTPLAADGHCRECVRLDTGQDF